MQVDIGKDRSKYLITLQDYLDVIREEISWDFYKCFETVLEHEREDIEGQIYEEGYYNCYENGNCHVLEAIEDAIQDIEDFLKPIKAGKRLNRERTIKLLEDVLWLLNQTSEHRGVK